jgi:hypothetical protein
MQMGQEHGLTNIRYGNQQAGGGGFGQFAGQALGTLAGSALGPIGAGIGGQIGGMFGGGGGGGGYVPSWQRQQLNLGGPYG